MASMSHLQSGIKTRGSLIAEVEAKVPINRQTNRSTSSLLPSLRTALQQRPSARSFDPRSRPPLSRLPTSTTRVPSTLCHPAPSQKARVARVREVPRRATLKGQPAAAQPKAVRARVGAKPLARRALPIPRCRRSGVAPPIGAAPVAAPSSSITRSSTYAWEDTPRSSSCSSPVLARLGPPSTSITSS